MVRSSQYALISETTEGIVTSWNDGATLLYGYSPHEILGKGIELITPRDALDQEKQRESLAARGMSESGFRCTRLRADGTTVDVVMSMIPIYHRPGKIVGIATISRHLSDLEIEDSRFHALLEASTDAIVGVDDAGRIVFANEQAAVTFGYGADAIVGMSVESLVPHHTRERHAQHRARYFADPRSTALAQDSNLQGLRRDGTVFPVEISLASAVTAAGAIVMATIRDVTAQRMAAGRLRDSETQLRQLAEHANVVFALCQIEPFAYLYVSPSLHELTGIRPEQLAAHPDAVVAMVHSDDQERFRCQQRGSRECVAEDGVQYRIVRSDGDVRWVRVSTTPIADCDGTVVRTVMTMEDITDSLLASQALAKAEAAARAANQAKNEFLSRMSHELRTPLNAVLGFGQMLERDLEDADHKDSARHIVRAGRHLLNLINEVLDISRIEAGELSVSCEAVLVAEIVGEAVALMQPLAADAGVTVSATSGDPTQFVRADRQRLRQILLNLISNAVKFNHRGGDVCLAWRADADRVVIDVHDDGPGIDPALHDRLFAPFDRLGVEVTGVEGAGIGLTVTRRLAQIMRGEVSVRSAVGSGSTFSVELPASVAPHCDLDVVTPLDTGHSTASASRTVLYIEDNMPNVKVMESVMRLRPEWRLIHAGLASLGLELARAYGPDLILLDVHLPDGPGYNVLTELKSDVATAQTYIRE